MSGQQDSQVIANSETLANFQRELELPDLYLGEVKNIHLDLLMFRQQIRQALVDYVQQRHATGQTHIAEDDMTLKAEIVQFMDLKQIPQSIVFSISISHCASLGIFSVTQMSQALGVDIEDDDRIQEAVVARISTAEEMESCPDSGLLWVAKEASYKSLYGHNQPMTASDVEIFAWEKKKNDYFSYSFKSNHSKGLDLVGRGLCCRQNRLNLSISKF